MVKVRLNRKGLDDLDFCNSPYEEFVTYNPEFWVRAYGDRCYLHPETGCTFEEEQLEILER